MSVRLVALAVLAAGLTVSADAARADCLWAVGMTERAAADIERAAPLAEDPTLQLGPGGSGRFYFSERDFDERALRAYGGWNGVREAAPDTASLIADELAAARERLEGARRAAARNDMETCTEALEEAREAIAAARAAFR